MRKILIFLALSLTIAAAGCVSTNGGSLSEQRVRQAAQAGEPEAQELMGKLAVSRNDSCGALAWFEKAGAQGRGYSQMFAAVLNAFGCNKGTRSEIRAYAWLTDEAIAARHQWSKEQRLLFFKMMRTPPDSVSEISPAARAYAREIGMSDQELLEDTRQQYADSRNLRDVPHMREWLRSRLTDSHVEAAMALRATLIN